MFGFPEKDRDEGFQYQRNFLRSVVLRIDYLRNRNIVDNKETFKNAFKDSFPTSSDIVDAQGILKFENGTPIFEPQSSSEQGIELKSKDLQKNLKITDSFTAYAVSGDEYTNFEESYLIIKAVFKAAQDSNIAIKNIKRAAIRKTNVIDFAINDNATIIEALSSMFNNVLNKSILELPKNEDINNYNQTIVYGREPHKLNLKYGYRKGPEQSNWNAILDIDIFREEAEREINADQVEEEFSKINKEIFNVFHWSLQDSLISELERQ